MPSRPHHFADNVARNLAQEMTVFFWGRCRLDAGHDPVVGKSCNHGTAPVVYVSRSGTILHCPDPASDHVAHHCDAAVGGGEMLETMAGNAAVNTDLRVIIARDPLALLV